LLSAAADRLPPFGSPAVSEETRGFADRPHGRGAIVGVRYVKERL
jgi:hypothetical protein